MTKLAMATLAVLASLAFAHRASAQLTFAPAWIGSSAFSTSSFGASTQSAGDVNGDGFDDAIVGAPEYSNGQLWEGAAFVFHGGVFGLASTASWMTESNVKFAYYGMSAAGVGDVNADGFDDVLVGAYQSSNGQSSEGRVYLYLGSASGLSTTSAWTYEPNLPNAELGRCVARAGDVNGDGIDDVVVGAPGSFAAGFAYVFHGAVSGLPIGPSRIIVAPQPNVGFGGSVASAGDVDGDGFGDVVVGAAGYSNGEAGEGAAYVYRGSSTGLGSTPAWSAEVNHAAAAFGASVAGAGDVDHDGYDDVIVGAPKYNDGSFHEGRAYLYRGSATGLGALPAWSPSDNGASMQFGSVVDGVGDVNADGYDDVVVGATRYPYNSRAFVFLGGPNGTEDFATWSGSTTTFVMNSLAGVGDVNGDSYDDVIMGAAISDNGTQNARVFHGGAYASVAPYGKNKVLSPITSLMSFAPPALGTTATIDFTVPIQTGNPGFLFMGLQPAALPFDDGTLNVVPLIVTPIFTYAGGTSIPVSIPGDSALLGVDVYFQAGYVEPAMSGYYHTVLSNGLHWTIGG